MFFLSLGFIYLFFLTSWIFIPLLVFSLLRYSLLVTALLCLIKTRLYVCIFFTIMATLWNWTFVYVSNAFSVELSVSSVCLWLYTGRQAQACCWVYTKIFNFNFNFNFLIIIDYLHQLQLVNTIILLTENNKDKTKEQWKRFTPLIRDIRVNEPSYY